MNKIFLKLFLSFAFVFTGFLFVDVEAVNAECVVNQANFRRIDSNAQSISQFSLNGWYQDNVRPYVYIDVQTSGCNGQTVEFSLTEWDDMEDAVLPVNSFVPTESLGAGSWNDDDVNGTDITFTPNIGSTEVALLLAWISSGLDPNLTPSFMGIGIDCNTSLPKCLDNRPIPIGAAPSESNFTIALQAGEDECEQAGDPECVYYVSFNDDPVPESANSINQVQTLKYNCDDACFEDWAWIQKIEFGGYHPNDPALQDSEEEEEGPGLAGQSWDIDIQNPIGGGDMTIVDFIQKVIDFALTIGIPIIAIAIIYAGLLFVTARGNDKQLETAKNAFTYAVIGGAILLGAFIFAKLIKETIESIVMISSYFG